MKTDKTTRQQRHQAQVKTQQGSAIRGAQSTEFVKGAGYRKTEFIGGKKYYSPMSSDPTSSGAGGDVTNITVQGISGGGGDIRSDGTVQFTAPQTGVTPTASSHLTTKAYVDSNAIMTSTYTTGTHNPGDGNVDLQSVFESSTKLYALEAGSNIQLNVVSPSSGDDYLQIRSTVNTAGFISTSANNIIGVRSFDADSIEWTQQNANGYITFDQEGSNVTFTDVTVDSDNKPAVRITAPVTTNTNTTYSISIPSSTTKFRLTAGGSGSGTDDIEFVGSGATSVTRTNADKFTISSNNNFVNGASCNSNGLLTLTGTGSAGAVVDLSEHLLTGITSSMVTTALGFTPYNNTNPSGYITASSTNTLTNKSGDISQWTNNSGYITGNQTINLDGDVSGSGTTSITVTINDDSHNHIISNVDGLQTALDAKAALAGATFTGGVACNGNTSNYPHLVVGGTGRIVSSSAALQVKGFVRLANHMLLHETNSSANAVGLTYANHNLSVYASSGTTAENSGQANFHVPGDVIAYYSSDPRLKENETKISKPLEKLKYINGYMFDWKKEAEAFNVYNTGRDIGVMADEIEAVLPEVVEERANGYKAVKYEKIIPLLIECVKEQQLQIDAMRKM